MNREKIGRRYPVHQLVTYMVRDSDNAATDLLLKEIRTRRPAAPPSRYSPCGSNSSMA